MAAGKAIRGCALPAEATRSAIARASAGDTGDINRRGDRAKLRLACGRPGLARGQPLQFGPAPTIRASPYDL